MIDHCGRSIDYLRISITDRCNLRCVYCMPEGGVQSFRHEDVLSYEEIVRVVRQAAALGVKHLRVTGGEPMARKGCLELVDMLHHIPGIETIALTTNGLLLDGRIAEAKAKGLTSLNISMDSVDAETFRAMTRGGDVNTVLRVIDEALAAGLKVKINAVLIGGFNDDEIETLAALTLRYPVDVRFIELMPMLDHPEFGPEAFIPCAAVLEKLPQAVPVPQDGGVARLYRLPGAQGNIGLISPVSAHFCAACNRIRLTADGKLKPCLHAAEEVSLKGLNAAQMRETMQRVIYQKPFRHAELSATLHSQAGRNMNQIGG